MRQSRSVIRPTHSIGNQTNASIEHGRLIIFKTDLIKA
jgi:hypothetical protein